MALSDDSSDFSLIEELDDACADVDCPGVCTHHLPRHSEVWYDRTETIASYEVVDTAASQGCRHCQFLKAAGQALLLAVRPKRDLSVLAQAFNKLHDLGSKDLQSVPGLKVKSFRIVTSNKGYEQYELGVLLSLDGEECTRLDYTVGLLGIRSNPASTLRMPSVPLESLDIVSDAISASNLKFMLGCISRCRNEHAECADSLPTSYPRRLLDVSSHSVQLVQDGPFREHYLALSYTWGSVNNPGILKTVDVATRLAGPLPFRLLQTLEDAVIVTRKLGFKYLWIDSMCIIQDDDADKGREIAKMHDIYNKAFLVISADSAKDPTSGLFDRSGAFEPMQVDLANGMRAQLMDASDHNEHSYTALRAWCFQERVVAQRTLIFSTRETIWECKKGTTCSCGQDQDRQNNFWNFANTALIFDQKYLAYDVEEDGHYVKVLNGVVRLTPLEFWWRTVERFTERQITKIEDRMPAISALAKTLAPSVEGSYLAGLWEADIAYGLSWACQSSVDAFTSAGPSWSWTTCPGSVYWRSPEAPLTRLRDWKLQVSKHHDEFSKVEEGVLTLTGPLMTASIAHNGSDQDLSVFVYSNAGPSVALQELPPLKSILYGSHDSRIPDSLPIGLEHAVGRSQAGSRMYHPVISKDVLEQAIATGVEQRLCILLWLSKSRALILSAKVIDSKSSHVARLGIVARTMPPDAITGTISVG